ncbi:unnamed protein product [Closterium sp. NIES-65]|nr:unnamed protein product [Closterium sp. NIES-65]
MCSLKQSVVVPPWLLPSLKSPPSSFLSPTPSPTSRSSPPSSHRSLPFFPPLPPPGTTSAAEVSRMAGRQARTTNVVMGGTATEYGDDWLELDKKVNTYPSLRDFTAIGSGGEDFAVAMVLAVQSVLPKDVPELQVVTRESATGRYISVKIGPVRMDSSEQVRFEGLKG